ncbi:guided entry of tail-anchored proteins factor 1-like isoform X2 [Portunus trituberculatus]|nr:guided entry of tail-anchored proteins factor 1-like isoform X2 [Portunus trituberculatus]XP_045133001.1 guided entry of tail-anchored proteins factor 1-like isoform X2 [Portunus trituberculatus]
MHLFIITTVLGCAGVVLPALLYHFIRAIGGEGPEERQIRQEVLRLKQQLQNISMVDQFANYARIQRKINSLNQQYKAKVSERSIGQQRVQLTVNGIIKTVVGLSCLWLVWENRSEPVVSLPDTLVWPLGPVLSFPSCQYGQISVVVWLAVVRTVCGRISNLLPSSSPKPAAHSIPSPFIPTPTPVSPPLD